MHRLLVAAALGLGLITGGAKASPIIGAAPAVPSDSMTMVQHRHHGHYRPPHPHHHHRPYYAPPRPHWHHHRPHHHHHGYRPPPRHYGWR